MYTVPGQRPAFGSVLAAPWLFDVYLRQDAVALSKANVSGGRPGFVTRAEPPQAEDFAVMAAATMDPTDVVLAHAGTRMALVLTDDCELASLAGERAERTAPRGRVLMVGIRAAKAAELTDARDKTSNLRNHVLEPDPQSGFGGGIVDFTRVFSVRAKTLFGSDAAAYTIVTQLDRDAQLDLVSRFAGFALRQGPLTAAIGARKLSQLISADGEPAQFKALRDAKSWGQQDVEAACRELVSVINESWLIGGALLDDVDTVAEQALLDQPNSKPDAEVAAIVAALGRLRDSADAAIARLARGR